MSGCLGSPEWSRGNQRAWPDVRATRIVANRELVACLSYSILPPHFHADSSQVRQRRVDIYERLQSAFRSQRSERPRRPRRIDEERAGVGAARRAGAGLPVVGLAGVADEGTGRLDRLEGARAAAEPAADREQRAVPDSALGAGEGLGEYDSVPVSPPVAARLGGPIWLSAADAGDAGGCAAFRRYLLSRRQLDSHRPDGGPWTHGPAHAQTGTGEGHLPVSTPPPCPSVAMRIDPVKKYA